MGLTCGPWELFVFNWFIIDDIQGRSGAVLDTMIRPTFCHSSGFCQGIPFIPCWKETKSQRWTCFENYTSMVLAQRGCWMLVSYKEELSFLLLQAGESGGRPYFYCFFFLAS